MGLPEVSPVSAPCAGGQQALALELEDTWGLPRKSEQSGGTQAPARRVGVNSRAFRPSSGPSRELPVLTPSALAGPCPLPPKYGD